MFPSIPLAGSPYPEPPDPGRINWSLAVNPAWLWCIAAAIVLGTILALILFRRHKLALISCLCLLLATADTALWLWSLRANIDIGLSREQYDFDPLRHHSAHLNLASGRGGIALDCAAADQILFVVPQMAAPPVDLVSSLYLERDPGSSSYPPSGLDYSLLHKDGFWDHWPWPQLGILPVYETVPKDALGQFYVRAHLTLPHWLLITLLLLTPAAWALRLFLHQRRQRHRLAHHLCLNCGYDLRAHQSAPARTKCPECATPIPQNPAPAASP